MKKNKAPKTHDRVPQLSPEAENVSNEIREYLLQEFKYSSPGEETIRVLKEWCSSLETRQFPPILSPPNDPQSSENMDKNSTAGPSSSSAARFPVKQENKERACQTDSDSQEDVIIIED